MTLPLTRGDARRRKRLRMPSRAILGNGIGAAEGLAAAALSLMLSYAHDALVVVAVAITAGIIYGALAAGAARKFVGYADLRQPYILHAVLSWPLAAAMAFLVALAASRWNLVWGRTFWVWVFLTPFLLALLRIAIYRQLATMFSRGQLQVERIGIIGDEEAVSRLRRDPRIWQQGGQVVSSLTLPEGIAGTLPPNEVIAGFARSCVEKKCQHVLLVADLENLGAVTEIV